MNVTNQYLDSLQIKSNRFYVVINGWETGIFEDWLTTKKQVHEFSNESYKIIVGRRDAVSFLVKGLEKFSTQQKLTVDQQQTLNSCKKLLEDWGPPEVFPSII